MQDASQPMAVTWRWVMLFPLLYKKNGNGICAGIYKTDQNHTWTKFVGLDLK